MSHSGLDGFTFERRARNPLAAMGVPVMSGDGYSMSRQKDC